LEFLVFGGADRLLFFVGSVWEFGGSCYFCLKYDDTVRNAGRSMTPQDMLQITIAFIDPELDSNEREAEALKLLPQLRDLDEVEVIERVAQPTPEGGKGLGFIPGWLMTQVSLENGKKLLGFLNGRLAGKTIELEVEGNGKKLKVKASNQDELKTAIAEAERFING
jgi:hypothetical protein